jgi:hypothetical protein
MMAYTEAQTQPVQEFSAPEIEDTAQGFQTPSQTVPEMISQKENVPMGLSEPQAKLRRRESLFH